MLEKISFARGNRYLTAWRRNSVRSALFESYLEADRLVNDNGRSHLIKYSYSNSATNTVPTATILTAAAAAAASSSSSCFLGAAPRAKQQQQLLTHHYLEDDNSIVSRTNGPIEPTATTASAARYQNGSSIHSNNNLLPPMATAREGAVSYSLSPSPFSTVASTIKRDYSTTKTTSTSSNNTSNNDAPSAASSAWQPNQLTSTYTKMQSICPDSIKAYAQCVISKQNEGVLEQGGCELEYGKLMDCFRVVRSSS